MYESVLVIGATGMLAEATAWLAERSESLTFTARSSRSVSRMNKTLANTTARCSGLALDWDYETKFISRLAAHCDESGYPSLTVAWLHNGLLGTKIARLFAEHAGMTTFYQIRGSAAARPGTDPLLYTDLLSSHPGLEYHQIILGFKIEENGSRWLSNAEISAGVISAVAAGDSLTLIGVVEPWEMRP